MELQLQFYVHFKTLEKILKYQLKHEFGSFLSFAIHFVVFFTML